MDSSWLEAVWPWLVDRARSVGVEIPPGDPGDHVVELLVAVAAKGALLDATLAGHVAAQALWASSQDNRLEGDAAALIACLERVDASVPVDVADELANVATFVIAKVRAVPPLAEALTAALGRCPQSATTARALGEYAAAPSPPPSPVAVTASSVGDDSQQDGERPPPTAEDRWAAFTATYNVGDVINGRVQSITKFGAFVQTAVGLDGLVHISELAHHHVRRVEDMLRVGEPVAVKIIGIEAERRRISLSLRAVEPHAVPVDDPLPTFDRTGAADGGAGAGSAAAEDRFMDEARKLLIDASNSWRPLLRDMVRNRGRKVAEYVERGDIRRAGNLATPLTEALADAAKERVLAERQLEVLNLGIAVNTDPSAIALAEATIWASRPSVVPTPAAVRDALDRAGQRVEVRDLVVIGLIRSVHKAINDSDATMASRVVDVAVALSNDLPQSKAKELVDLLSSLTVPDTYTLKLDELRDRADPMNRPDLAALTDREDRRTLLRALPMLQAQVAAEVCRDNRENLLAQAKMWLAQQLKDTLKTWMPPQARHPAVVEYEQKLADWKRTRRWLERQGRVPNNHRKPQGLSQEVVNQAMAGSDAAVRQVVQALDPHLRTKDPTAEEWDAYLAALLTELPRAAATWGQIRNPSPEVCWNLALFDANQPFSKHLAWRHLEQALGSFEAKPETLLHALYLAVQTLADADAPVEARRASEQFFVRWGLEVPEPRILLAVMALVDASTKEGYTPAYEAFSRWSRLADPPALFPSVPRRVPAEARSAIQELRRDTRYPRKWLQLAFSAAAATSELAVSVLCLNEVCEMAEATGEDRIAGPAHERAVELARQQLVQARGRPTEAPVRSVFEQTIAAALNFARRTGDQRLGRHVRRALDETEHQVPNRLATLLTEVLGPDGNPTPPPPQLGPETPIPPALAELVQPFNTAKTAAQVAALRPRLLSALSIVGASDELVQLVTLVMDNLARLAGGVAMREAGGLLEAIGRSADQLTAAYGRGGDNSLSAMLKAVDRARKAAAEQITDAPTPSVALADAWAGAAVEAERPQVCLVVVGPPEDTLAEVAVSAGWDAVQVGRLAAGEQRTLAVPAKLRSQGDGTAEVEVELRWTSWGISGRTTQRLLRVPVSSWGGLLAEAGVAGLEIPNRFVVGEPLTLQQVTSGLFQGRMEHLSHVADAYTDDLPAQPTCFHGIRKVGKSSLLNRVVAELQASGRVVVMITAQGVQPRRQDQESIVALLCRRIVKNASPLALDDVPPRVDNAIAFLEDFFEAFSHAAKQASAQPPILVIDEFHCLYNDEVGGILDVFRMYAESRTLGFVFAATEGPSGLPTSTSLLVTPRRVDFLVRDDVERLLDAVFDDTPMVVPADVRHRLFDASAGHPNFTSAIGRRALEAANDGKRNVLCANDVDVAVREIADTRTEMFETSWFAKEILNDRERAAAVDLAFTVPEPRSWMRVSDVLVRLGDGGRDVLYQLTSTYVLEAGNDLAGEREVRIRGAVLERWLRSQHGVTLEPSPDTSHQLVGLFVDIENLIRAAESPEELADSLMRFGARFGDVSVAMTTATEGALMRAGWNLQRVENAFNAAGWKFRPPPRSLASKENIADHVVLPVITQFTEQFNLAEVIVGSGDHSFIPVVQAVLDDAEEAVSASGRRVHAIAMADPTGGANPSRHPEWRATARRRYHVCQVLAVDRPDLVLWDVEAILPDPLGAEPITPAEWPEGTLG